MNTKRITLSVIAALGMLAANSRVGSTLDT